MVQPGQMAWRRTEESGVFLWEVAGTILCLINLTPCKSPAYLDVMNFFFKLVQINPPSPLLNPLPAFCSKSTFWSWSSLCCLYFYIKHVFFCLGIIKYTILLVSFSYLTYLSYLCL